jgi:tellurite resistance protein
VKTGRLLSLEKTLWRQTPPAIFPVSLGFMALGLGWRNASNVLPIAHEIGDMMLAGSSAFFVFFFVVYARKIIARPSVLFEDMTSPAARGGVAAAAMSMMMLAAALLPFGISAPQVWWAGVILQIAASALVCYAIWKDPPEKRHFTPFQYLTFDGPVVGPIAGIPLGYVWESIALTYAALLAHVIITFGYGFRLAHILPPMQMRPSLAIFLAPNCLFAISFGLLGIDWAFTMFYWIASIVALVLVMLAPWLTKSGWSPAWAAFTFPAAAFLNLQVLAVAKGAGALAIFGVYAGLVLATPLILFIAYRFAMSWITGELGEKCGAAIA